jgi:hypothetical protein
MTPCRSMKVNRHFGGNYHHQGRNYPAYFLLISCLASTPEDGENSFMWYVSWHSPNYTSLFPRRWNSSYSPLRKPHILQNDLEQIYAGEYGGSKRKRTPQPFVSSLQPFGRCFTDLTWDKYRRIVMSLLLLHKKTKLRDLSPQANYTDRATATCQRS